MPSAPSAPIAPETPSTRHKLLLVDGSSYLYRAYHALPNLTSRDGFPTGALHGMVAMLKKLRTEVPARYAACVFDAKGKTFRDDWYPEYKANRSAMPEDLVKQVQPIHEVVKLLGWPVLEVPGIEADDVIGTLARHARTRGLDVLVSTGDKDLAQLVDEHVTLINTMSGERLDVQGVIDKFGVPPQRIVDYLTLVGDSVDNVPGVDKVGPKTAAKWIQEHGSLDAVVAAAPTMKGAVGEHLRRALDWLPMGRKLVTVKDDCDLTEAIQGWPAIDALHFVDADAAALLEFYTRHDFRSWKRELESTGAGVGATTATVAGATTPARASAAPLQPPPRRRPPQGGLFDDDDPVHVGDAAAEPTVPSTHRAGDDVAEAAEDATAPTGNVGTRAAVRPADGHYETILDAAALARWVDSLRQSALTALDTETTTLDPMQARIVGISFAVRPGHAAYVPIAHDGPDAPAQLDLDTVLTTLRPWLEDERAAKIGQNVKYDLHVFENHGIQVRGYVHDTMLQSYVLDAHLTHALDRLADRHLDRHGLTYEEVCGKGAHQIPFSQVPIDRATRYSGEDSEMVLDVHRVLAPRLDAAPALLRVYRDIEMPTVALLQRIERHGVLIDVDHLALQSKELAERMSALERQAHEIAGMPFNLGSPKQIGEVLFGKLGLPVKRKTASGAPSTDEDVLQELAADYPLPATLLEHRSLAKLKGTYTDKLPSMVNPRTGRVHTNYAQAVAITGRLSSNDPNLQNIPIRTPEGRRVRQAFVAPQGHRLASADYSQIELRIMAHISEDPGLLQAFADGVDVHRATAAEVFGTKLDEVTSEQRRYAKVINFGLIYGMGAFGLAGNLGIEQKAARNYIQRYFERFAGVKRYMDDTKLSARDLGYVETLFGRRITLPEIKGGSGPRRAGAERQAINAPMQGTAADLMKLAMLKVQDAIDREQRATRLVMQVHDEMVMEVPAAEEDWVRERVPALMAEVAEMKVPLVAQIGFGTNWDEAH
jgi:DNA polymerase I